MKVLDKKNIAVPTGDERVRAVARALVRAGYTADAIVQAVLAIECRGRKFDRAHVTYVANMARRTASAALNAKRRADLAINAAKKSPHIFRVTQAMREGAQVADFRHEAILGKDY